MLADPTPLEQAAELYAATFAGRLDAYSFWNGEHWQATRKPLTGQVVVNAFKTGIPLSAYLLSPESKTHVACLDIDRDDGAELGKRFLAHLQRLKGVGYFEASRRGCHVWMLLPAPAPGVLVRRALKALIHEAGLPDDPKIELRPGSDKLNGEDSLGHCIRMPTMPHQKTGKRYGLISSDGETISGKLTEMMLQLETCPMSLFEDAAERAPLPPLGAPPSDLRYPTGTPPLGSVTEILQQLWGVPGARPGKAVKCPAHDDHRPSLSIARDDQRVWCKSPHCILNNNDRGRGTHELTELAPKGVAHG